MLKDKNNQLSIYSILYNKIPENHILKLINNAIDFSFINKLLEKSYCKYYGRPAKEPELMLRLLILQYLYNLSDERVIEEASLNLAYLWFLGINPEEELPHPSLLAKFRVHRLQEVTMDEIITEVVKQCVEKNIIKSGGISIDCTHTHANTVKKVPERILKHIAKKIFKNLEKEAGEIPEEINTNIPNYKEIAEHREAKATMKAYVEEVIAQVEEKIEGEKHTKTCKVIEKAREILEDPKFIEQKSIRSLVDQDARVGYKSKTESFFGYKTEYAMTTKERIITAVRVYNGAYVDGTGFEELIDLTKDSGIEIKEVYGDKAYFRKPILDVIKENGAEAYIPISEMVYKIDESKYAYNKDSDQWFCDYGNYTVEKQRKIRKRDGRESWKYKFDVEGCQKCPKKDQCFKIGKSNTLEISVNIPEYYEYSQRAKTKEFIEKYKERASQEWKNGEMKRFHGLSRARGYGLRSMSMQSKLTALAVNLKRIAQLVSSLSKNNHYFLLLKIRIKCFRLYKTVKVA
ncbi:transposase [Acetivibrio clariflavus DSM 19732]|uniref:Transposase n=1 Tax=Acetivibrio clariflavus (strain DSM 19732 / NBRC 101661 / EBR45) TaxID=720554 RepID=G8LV94_ACECE|nr:transposase [Acetivibrio clariflavus DSM 19732]